MMDENETIFGSRWEEILEEITRDLAGEPSPSDEAAE
jgi:hypothetical protein